MTVFAREDSLLKIQELKSRNYPRPRDTIERRPFAFVSGFVRRKDPWKTQP